MRTRHVLAAFSLIALAACDNENHEAPVADNQPEGAAYLAVLPDKPETTIRGNITAVTAPDLRGVVFSVAMEGLPTEGGPFPYHVHDQPVDAEGNCSSTLAHLDPFSRGEMPRCDPENPETCQVGDLAGKHGMLQAPEFTDSYTDLFVDMRAGKGSFIGNRSITIHFSNGTRITCANFGVISMGEMIGKDPEQPPPAYPSSTSFDSSLPTPVPFPTSRGQNLTSLTLLPSGTLTETSTSTSFSTSTTTSTSTAATDSQDSAAPTSDSSSDSPSSEFTGAASTAGVAISCAVVGAAVAFAAAWV